MAFTSVKKLTFSAILIALGILIPMIMPIKIVIGPASYTLASHVPVFLAMFISPGVAVAVALGTAFGFFLSFPAIIALRALSHVVFAVIGAYILQKKPTIVSSFWQFQAFSALIGLIHAATELLVVILFTTGGQQTAGTFWVFFLTVGVGGFVHSMVDFTIAYYLGERLSRQFDFPVFAHSQLALKQYLQPKV
ncbi:hypothetical protein I6N95_18355 [Vagococcus sp. BWB3-3]|uniref:Niacin transporter NiaX n=1 Tax=Vagococcus allomyrinae TaxID=2794353 RepID=A0A940P8F5_9ENTE|nr:hypothetical protein [Vagococcus allomyrinae]MBP1042980.1 hypothetical protein [Vagococcus allomyrinae]